MVQERPNVFDAQHCLTVLHGEQDAFEVEHLDAIRAAFHNAAAERFALAQFLVDPLHGLAGLQRILHQAVRCTAMLQRIIQRFRRLIGGGCKPPQTFELP